MFAALSCPHGAGEDAALGVEGFPQREHITMTGAHVDGDLFANLGPDSEQTDAHAVAKVDRRLVPSALVTEANYAVSEAADSSAAADETTVSLQSADASKQCSPPESFNASPCREQPQTAAPIRASLTPTRASLRTSQSGSKRSLKETVKRVSHMTRNSSSKVFPVRLVGSSHRMRSRALARQDFPFA